MTWASKLAAIPLLGDRLGWWQRVSVERIRDERLVLSGAAELLPGTAVKQLHIKV